MAVSDVHVFPGFLTPVLTFLSKATDYFSHMLPQRQKYAGKFASTGDQTHNHHVSLNKLTTEPPGLGYK